VAHEGGRVSIHVASISKRFGEAVALDDVSLEVPSGSLTALLGPSGGGKSTLLRIIAGLDTPDAGTVRIEGEDLTGAPARQRGVGFCFQHYAPFRHLTVRRNIAFGLEIRHRPKAEVKARVDELLDLVGLAHLAERYPSQLSGGQRQRMALARALAIEPKVLLLDEPFGALDAQVRTQLRLWLRDLHDTLHVTTVLVTHDQEEAMEVADRLAIINHGRLEQVGTPSDMYDHPANEFVLTFLGPATRLGGDWVRPHDLVVHGVGDGHPLRDAVEGTVTRVTHLGFEVKVDVALAAGGDCWVQLSRGTAADLGLEPGQRVWVARAESSVRGVADHVSIFSA
jgi:sulfate transport system ATP-binding protein